MRALILLGIAVFCPMSYMGYLVGRANSPDYDSEAASASFLLANAKITRATFSDATVELDAGFRHYRYTASDDRLVEMPLISKLGADYEPPRRRDFELEKADKILGISSAISTAAVTAVGAAAIKGEGLFAFVKSTIQAEATSGQPWNTKVAMIVGGVLGGGVGYWIGYSDKRDYDSATFKRTMEDKRYWRFLATQVQFCAFNARSMKFRVRSDKPQSKVDVAINEVHADIARNCTVLEKEIG